MRASVDLTAIRNGMADQINMLSAVELSIEQQACSVAGATDKLNDFEERLTLVDDAMGLPGRVLKIEKELSTLNDAMSSNWCKSDQPRSGQQQQLLHPKSPEPEKPGRSPVGHRIPVLEEIGRVTCGARGAVVKSALVKAKNSNEPTITGTTAAPPTWPDGT